jgi:hypothetical protein
MDAGRSFGHRARERAARYQRPIRVHRFALVFASIRSLSGRRLREGGSIRGSFSSFLCALSVSVVKSG